MNKYKKFLNVKQIFFFNIINLQIFVLFGLIILLCMFSDFYFKYSNLTIPFIITTLISSVITFLGVPKLKKIKAKQIIREQ